MNQTKSRITKREKKDKEIFLTNTDELTEKIQTNNKKIEMIVCKYFNPNQFFITNNDNTVTFFERWKKYITLVITTDELFVEIFKKIRQNYKFYSTIEYIKLETDLIQYICKIFCLYIGDNLEEIKKRYIDNFDEVEERMFIRIELFKHGWTLQNIENYINKYVIKGKKIKIDNHYYSLFFGNLFIMLNIVSESELITNLSRLTNIKLSNIESLKINNKDKPLIKKSKGRPSIPKTLKEHLNKKHTEKINKNMKLIYSKAKKYDELQKFKLEESDMTYLTSVIKDDLIFSKIKNIFEITV